MSARAVQPGSLLDRLTERTTLGLTSVLSRVLRRPLAPILLYHSVMPSDDPSFARLDPRAHNVPPDVFCAHVRTLARHFDVVTVDEMAKCVRDGLSLHGMAAITFDDGYRSVLDHAVPVLEEAKVPATLFLTGALLQTGTWWRGDIGWLVREKRIADFLAFASQCGLDVDGIRDDPEGFHRDTKAPGQLNTRSLAEALAEYRAAQGEEPKASEIFCRPEDLAAFHTEGGCLHFGNHGLGHHVLSGLTPEEQREEIVLGKAALRNLGLPISSIFSVPFGGSACIDDATRTALREAGYSGYLLSSGQGRTGDMDENLVVLSRVMPKEHQPRLAGVLARQQWRRI